MWKECREWETRRKSWQEMVGRILGEEDEGEWRMREMEREKNRMEGMEEGERGRRNGRREV